MREKENDEFSEKCPELPALTLCILTKVTIRDEVVNMYQQVPECVEGYHTVDYKDKVDYIARSYVVTISNL